MKKRFHFWRVFWVVTAVCIVLLAIGIIVASLEPSSQGRHYDSFKELLTWKRLVKQIVAIFFTAAYYYYTLNGFYRLYSERKSSLHFIRYSVLAFFSVIIYFVCSILVESDNKEVMDQLNSGIIFFSFFMMTLFYLGLALLIPYFTYLRDERKKQKVLEEQKMQLEVEKSQANFNFLKAQINPHFLHNTLNFLYSKSLPYSPELSEGILTLSDIMRYALSEGNTVDDKAPLKDEIEHVRNVIKIQQLRFSNTLNVNFNVEGAVNGATIIPFVLITLVENAFKHGDLKDTGAPIDIKVKISSQLGTGSRQLMRLYFYCKNRKKTGPKELSTGIGLDNIKKRLDLAYGSNYHFNVKDDGTFYTTELTIDKL